MPISSGYIADISFILHCQLRLGPRNRSQTERGPGLPGGGATETLPPPAEGGGPSGQGHSPRLPLAPSGTTELESTVVDMTRPKTADGRLPSETGRTRLKPRGITHLQRRDEMHHCLRPTNLTNDNLPAASAAGAAAKGRSSPHGASTSGNQSAFPGWENSLKCTCDKGQRCNNAN